MARGRHRRRRRGSFSRVLPALAAAFMAMVGVVSCEAGGVTGTVEQQFSRDTPEGNHWLLSVRTSQGALKEVRLPFAPWDRCSPGEPYPSCKQPPSYRAEEE